MKACIIGLGNIATVHATVLNELEIEISDVCDEDESKAKDFVEKFCNGANVYTDYKECIANTTADVIHIATPHYLHKEMTVFALKEDKNVLCEKPLCISEKELEEILEAESKAHGKLGVCQQNRYNEASIIMHERLKDKKIKSASATLNWYRSDDYYLNSDWRGKKDKEGGSVMINQALHTLDLVQWFIGMPEYCVAETHNLMHKGIIDTEDTATCLFWGENDFDFYASLNAKINQPPFINVVTIDGDDYKMFGNELYVNGNKINVDSDIKTYGKSCYGGGHFALFKRFYDSVEKNVEFEISGSEAGKVIKLILAIYKSKGEKIKV